MKSFADDGHHQLQLIAKSVLSRVLGELIKELTAKGKEEPRRYRIFKIADGALQDNEDICNSVEEEEIEVLAGKMADHVVQQWKTTAQDRLETHRSARITDGLDIDLVHKVDLDAFIERINCLFEWHKQEHEVYLAPYFALVQSSGMGKTKLFTEYRNAVNKIKSGDEQDQQCRTILCVDDANLATANRQKYFDHVFAPEGEERTMTFVKEKLDNIVTDVQKSSKGCKRLVLFFDEAQGLMTGTDSNQRGNLAFRAVRWWLRLRRPKIQVVAVFAGTTTKISNFFPPDPPRMTVSRDPLREYVNYNEKQPPGDESSKKLYPPFFHLNTVACFLKKHSKTTESTDLIELSKAAMYGRPLFAYYAMNDMLEANLLESFAKRLVLSELSYENSLSACCSVLGARVQMGVVDSFQAVSEMVSSGYACLTEFRETGSTHVLGLTFMPDPLCAFLAMRFMDDEWQCATYQGRPKKFWVEKAADAFTSKLCKTEKGDVGEIFTALYLLLCGDVLRKQASTDLSTFTVSLQDWFTLVKSGGSNIQDTPIMRKEARASRSATDVHNQRAKCRRVICTLSFIQICRNDFRANSFCNPIVLEHLYASCVGCYAYKNCKAIDIVSSIRVVKETEESDKPAVSFHPLLVSVKNWSSATKSDVGAWVASMKGFLTEMRDTQNGDPTAVCVFVLVGCKSPPHFEGHLDDTDLADFPFVDVFRFVCLPDGDNFGISRAIERASASSDDVEMYASHAFLSFADPNHRDKQLRASSTRGGDLDTLFQALNIFCPSPP